MKLLIEMEPEHYDEFLNCCSDIRPEYAILKNGIVLHTQSTKKTGGQ
jgi:hypothetical protein